jgi:polyferredoxin
MQSKHQHVLQRRRRITQTAFFILFVLAPIFDIFRLDLNLGHFIIFGQDWTLGLEQFQRGNMTTGEAVFNIVTRVFLPLALVAGLLIGTAWKFGRLYCGWLCPHFSVVETINQFMFRASGKPSLWEKHILPAKQADASLITPNKKYWLHTGIAILFFSFLWAVTFLTYLLPPNEIYHNLFNASLTRNQSIFIGVARVLLTIEFTFARHLFCRFACAVGVFQSLAWMGNKRAMVVGFNDKRATECHQCNNACDNACPMRLHPRSIKRKMFTCTTCAQCISACSTFSEQHNKSGLLKWVADDCALHVSDRGFGKFPQLPAHCFEQNKKTQMNANERKYDIGNSRVRHAHQHQQSNSIVRTTHPTKD